MSIPTRHPMAIADSNDEPVSDIAEALEAMRQALGDPTYCANQMNLVGEGLWMVELPEADAAELAANGFWGRENEDGYSIESDLRVHTGDCAVCGFGGEAETLEAGIAEHDAENDHPFTNVDDLHEDTGRGDHFGNCAKCGVSYEARSAEQAIEDHDMHEGHAFVPFAPSWQIEITREDSAPIVGEAEAREVLAALFTQLHGYHEPMENQGGGIWLAAIPQPLVDVLAGGGGWLDTVTPANIRYGVGIETP